MLYGAGSSDPRVRFKVTGTKYLSCSSKCIKKSLDPSWRETFSLPLTKDYAEDEKPIDFGVNGPILEVTCEDVDAVSSADFMGALNLPVCARRPFFAFSCCQTHVRHRGDGVVGSFYATGESSGPLVRRRRDPKMLFPRSSTPSRSGECGSGTRSGPTPAASTSPRTSMASSS